VAEWGCLAPRLWKLTSGRQRWRPTANPDTARQRMMVVWTIQTHFELQGWLREQPGQKETPQVEAGPTFLAIPYLQSSRPRN
jgi:hypothetical protein